MSGPARFRIFNGAELTVEHVVASACLPMVFQAVEIEGEPYWDGGYSGNPPLFPLFYETQSDDILLVPRRGIRRRKLSSSASRSIPGSCRSCSVRMASSCATRPSRI